MTPAWVIPTARATPWQPLAGVSVCLALVTAGAAYTRQWPAGLFGPAAAAVAAAVVAGLHDPAAALLAAMPTSAARRRVRRGLMLLPAALLVWLGYVGVGRTLTPGLGWPVGEAAALTASGLAVAVWWPMTDAVAAGAAAPLLWFAASWAGRSLDEDYAEVLFAWHHHPWAVTVAAVSALLIGRNR
jgi:hypothetical protein